MTVMGLAALFAVSLAAAVAAIAVASYLPLPARRQANVLADDGDEVAFIFDDETLVDATARGRALLAAMRGRGSAWDRLTAYIEPRFPGIGPTLARLRDVGAVTVSSEGDDPLVLRAEWRGGLRRIVLIDANRRPEAAHHDAMVQRAQDDELRSLRSATEGAPFPMWQEGSEAAVVWANDRYMDAAVRAGAADRPDDWPPPAIFGAAGAGGRVALAAPEGPEWFDVLRIPVADGALCYALPAGRAVAAEAALRDFVQTLSKTFADLPIGLAVFDRARRLILFNPALTDLIALPVDFLSARPTLNAMLDAMRDRRLMPEPKDYKAWRQRIAGPAADAAPVAETWSLTDGRTFRVSLRHHPEGALAMLVEDVSAEVGRLRTARADIALGQSVLDALDEAVAVFAADGTLAQANRAALRLWGDDADTLRPGTPAQTLVRAWAARCAPDPAWARIEAALAAGAEVAAPDPVEATLRLRTGRLVRCKIAPLPGGARLAVFGHAAPRQAALDRARRSGAESPQAARTGML